MKSTSLLAIMITAASAFAQAPDPPMSPSARLNAKLPSWLKLGGEYRARLEDFENGGFTPNTSDAYLLNRARLDVLIKPTSWLTFFGEVQDARVFWKNQSPPAVPYQDAFNLRQGYFEIRGTERWSIRTGRQEINFGDQRLVGSSNWLNTARTFDAVLGTANYGSVRVTGFVASVVELSQTGFIFHHRAGNNLHGVYSSFSKMIPKAVFEPYWFWRLDPRARSEGGINGKLDLHTFGIRAVGQLPGRFEYNFEAAGQRGHRSTDTVAAWAGHWQVSRLLSTKGLKPKVYGEYNFASGDGDKRDGVHNTFDVLYPTPHDKYGLADQVGWKNIHHLGAGVEVRPQPRLSLQLKYQHWWLANARDSLYAAGGSPVATLPDGSGGTDVGQEVDVEGIFNWTRELQVGFGIGHLFPGEFLQKATPGKPYTSPYLFTLYTF
jgi:Alginate export